jgi:hypothetical protein
MCALSGSALASSATAPVHDGPTLIIVVGAAGTPEYGREFDAWAERWGQAARKGLARVEQIGRDELDPATAPATAPATPAITDRDRLLAALKVETFESPHPLWVVLMGHGTSDAKDTKFNLRGPDISNQELAEWLKPIQRPVAVIDCSAASAPFLNRLSAPHRVVITATRSGSEIQYSRFGEFMSLSITDPSADLDKDGQTSLLEAFLAASHRTEEFYKQAGRLMTEHALLDDNGDGLGTAAEFFQGLRAIKAARDGAPLDGPRARQWHLVRSAEEQAIPTELRAQRDEIELSIESLRQRKSAIPEQDYYAQLEDLMLQLARLYKQIETGAHGPKPPLAR